MVNSNMAIERIELEKEGELREYTITLDPNGGYIKGEGSIYMDPRHTTEPYVIHVEYNSSVGVLPVPTRPGYTFKGWVKTYAGFWN